MSDDLKETLREEAWLSAEFSRFAEPELYARSLDRIEELEAEVHRLHTAEFIGRLPDYVKELETERDEAHDRIEELEAALRLINNNGSTFNGFALADIARQALGDNDAGK